MGLIRTLWKESAAVLCAALGASAGCAVLMMALLRMVSQFIADPHRAAISAPLFLTLAVVMVALQLASTSLIDHLASRTVWRIRTGLVETISAASLVRLEQIGTARLATALGEEQVRIGTALPSAVALTRDLVFIAAALAYLAWLSSTVFAVLVAALGSGYFLYRPLQGRAGRRMQDLGRSGSQLFKLCRDLVAGAPQLRLANDLELPLREALNQEEAHIHRLATRAGFLFASANCIAVLYFVALVAIMMFGNIRDFIQPALVTTYTMILFFMLAPLQNVGNLVQGLVKAGVSLKEIEEIESRLSRPDDSCALSTKGSAEASGRKNTRIERIECRKLTYEYTSDERQRFVLLPVDFSIRAGEVAFVVGGNGSGKTTFLKVLCGLYAPTGGGLYVDGARIAGSAVASYRRQIAAVFSDNCLFEGLSGSPFERHLGEQAEIIRRLRLEHALRPESGILAQSSSLSSGERKRMAYFLATQSDAQVIVFDEFAADQDPEAKDLFYHEILRDLKEQGKIIVAVTHDDRYFGVADQVLVLERGMQAGVRRQASRKAAPLLKG